MGSNVFMFQYTVRYAVCRCFYRPQKPFKDYIEKIVKGKAHAVKPTARNLQVSCLRLAAIGWCIAVIHLVALLTTYAQRCCD